MIYRFCPQCSRELPPPPHEADPQRCSGCGVVHYKNSKPTADVLMVDGSRVLLGRRARDPGRGLWDIPGGFLDLGEHPESGARREVREEVGVEIDHLRLLTITTDHSPDYGATLNLHYLAILASGVPRPGDDIAELGWFTAADLPDDMAFRNGKEALDAWLITIGRSKKYSR